MQRAADAHGGAVFVDQPRGDGWGATFAFYLPALPAEEAGGLEVAVEREDSPPVA